MINQSGSPAKRMPSPPSAAVMVLVLSLSCLGSWTANGAQAQATTCVGDCNHDDRLTIDELITGVNMALGTLPVDRCPDFDPGGNHEITVDELIAGVNSALSGCGSRANHAPRVSDVSLGADLATPYVQKQLIGSDDDNDTITYELVADESGSGYSFAYINPESGVLYVTLEADFQGTIVLPYRVTDGRLFSDTANVTIEVEAVTPSRNSGLQDVAPEQYASFPRGFYNGALLGAPGANPTLPSAVDLTDDYPLPGNQGDQDSCVGWALGYAIKTYQERVEHGWSLEPAEHRFSPAYLYNQLNGGGDNGVIYNQGLDFLVDQGVATLALMPYNEFDFLTQPSEAARQEAAQFKAKSWKAANGVLEIKDALANRLPVFMVIQLLDDIYGLRGPDSVYNTFNGAWHTGHGVAAVGYDDNRYGGAFKIINSWGQDWGDGGYFWMPYSATNVIVDTPRGPTAVLTGGVVVEDLPDPDIPDQDPVHPPPSAELPDLQVTDWNAHYDARPGGSGTLQYTVTNTGIATAPAGAYVALVLSQDPTFTSINQLVVYDQIPFELAPGATAYRDENNSIAFYFPQNIQAGEYYIAVDVDIWNDVVESNEDDNVSPSNTVVEVENTLPDLQVQSWYARWDELGNGSLTYDVVNDGASTAPGDFVISLVLSPNDTIGDGDEIYLFDDSIDFDVAPGGSAYRDESTPAAFSIVSDYLGHPVPTGVYYLALWADADDSLAESNKLNNASLSWGTVGITNGFTAGLNAPHPDARSAQRRSTLSSGEAYNGKILPERQASVRKVRITDTGRGGRQLEFLDGGEVTDGGPRAKLARVKTWPKFAHAHQHVIFPVTQRKPMPDRR